MDFLDSAIGKLEYYSQEYSVKNEIKAVKTDIDNYQIDKAAYDLIVAVSSLEHTSSELILEKVLNGMISGTKNGGINCIIVNSEMEEIDYVTGEQLDVLMEINLPTEEMLKKLRQLYKGWSITKEIVNPLEYKIKRDNNTVLLKTNAITFVAINERGQ